MNPKHTDEYIRRTLVVISNLNGLLAQIDDDTPTPSGFEGFVGDEDYKKLAVALEEVLVRAKQVLVHLAGLV